MSLSNRRNNCFAQEEALKKNLLSCNADLKSKIDARSAELGEPARNGRVLLGGPDRTKEAKSVTQCQSVMKRDKDLLAECKADLAVHNENAEIKSENEKLKSENEKPKAENEKLKAQIEKLEADYKKLQDECSQ